MSLLLCLLGGVALIDTVVWHRVLARAIARPAVPARPPAPYPSLTVIRPVRGLDVGAAANARAALAGDYPGEVETVFAFDDERDPALPIVRQVIEEHRAAGRPGSAAIAIVGEPPAGRTGKLHAMMVCTQRARGELIAFGDSDTRPEPGLLTALVDALHAAPDVGATFAPVVVSHPLQTSGDLGYALLLNALYGPAAARATSADGALPFIMGQIMVFRRDALDAIGGVACAQGQLVDDMYIGRCVSAAGFRNVMVTRALPIATGGMRLTEFLRTYRRWILFGRAGLPLAFTWPLWLRGLEAWLAPIAAFAALASGAAWAAVPAAAAFAAQGLSLLGLHRRFGGARVPPRIAWMAWGVFLLAPAVLLSMRSRRVDWRGRQYALAPGARLDAHDEPRNEDRAGHSATGAVRSVETTRQGR